MPYSPANNSIIQAILKGRLNGQVWMNVIHFRPIDPPAGEITDGAAHLDEIATIIDDPGVGWSFLRAVYTSTTNNIDSLQLQYVWPDRYAYRRYDADTVVGTQAGDAAPQNVGAVYTLQSDEAGRSKVGSQHVCGLTAADVVGGMVDSVIAGHIDSEATYLLTPFTTIGEAFEYEMCIFHRAAPALSASVTHATVQPEVRVERRRTVGLGI